MPIENINIPSQVSQTITNGVTDKAPSESAVYNYLLALSTGMRIIAKSTTDGNISVTNTNTLSASSLIPAGTFVVGDAPRISGRARCTGLNAGRSVRMYFNTTNDLSGATLCAVWSGSAVQLTLDFGRMFYIKSSTVTEFVNTAFTGIPADGGVNFAPTNNNINWAIDQYMILAVQATNTADTMIVSGYKLTN